MSALTKQMYIYHADLGMPHDCPEPVGGKALTYTVHAYAEARKDRVQDRLPRVVPMGADLIEAKVTWQNEPVSWVLRTSLDRDRDLVLVVTSEYMVKTVWVNRKDDPHATLDVHKYDRPGAVGRELAHA